MNRENDTETRRNIGGMISVVGRARRLAVIERMRPLEIMPGAGLFLASLLEEDGCNQDELAARLFMDKATCCRALRFLEDEGYVVRREVEHNRRMKSIHVTNKAHAVHAAIAEAVDEVNERLVEGMTPDEQHQLQTLLARVEANARTLL